LGSGSVCVPLFIDYQKIYPLSTRDDVGKLYSKEYTIKDMENPRQHFWEKAGGASDYNAEWKEKVIGYIQKILKKEGIEVGSVILDLGSGKKPVSELIAPSDSKVIYVDFNAPEEGSAHDPHMHIQRDIHDLLENDSFSLRRSQLEAAKFVGVDPRSESTEHIDTVIVSDILNYVPSREVLQRADAYLKPGGVLIILNQPGRTFDYAAHTLSPEGASDNESLKLFLTEELEMVPVYEETTKDNYFIGAYQKQPKEE
jgi:SAM-dependent methyltransferase